MDAGSLKRRRRSILTALLVLIATFTCVRARDNEDCADCAAKAAQPGPYVENLRDVIAQSNAAESEDWECAVSDPSKKIKNVVFVFEGFRGYNDAVGKSFRKFQSMQPQCSTRLTEESARPVVEFKDRSWMDFYGVLNQMHNLVEKGAPNALKQFILKGLCLSGSMNFEDTEVIYLGESASMRKAAQCAEKLVQNPYRDAHGIYRFPSLSVLGYSYGGSAALRFAHRLESAGVRVDLGMTVDPVPQNPLDVVKHGAYLSLGLRSGSVDATPDYFYPPKNTRWVNYWQETDNRVNHGKAVRNVGLHGRPVPGATVNELVVPPVDFQSPANGGHWKIFEEHHVSYSIENELQSVARRCAAKDTWRKAVP